MLGLGIDIDTDSKYHININFIIGIFLLQFTIYKKQPINTYKDGK
jgi:hypothetical protein